MADLFPLQQKLSELLDRLRANESDNDWQKVASTAQLIADALRDKDGLVDNHTLLGKTSLPKTLASLFTLALHGSATPDSGYATPVLEILRVAANLCMDHDGNRASLLGVGLPQALVSLLRAYTKSFDPASNFKPLPISLSHLKVIRTAVGVLLNASVGYDPVKTHLLSLEAGSVLLKLSVAVYPPGAWLSFSSELTEEVKDEWQIRSIISGWVWRALVELKESKDEKDEKEEKEQSGLQSLTTKDLPLLISSLVAFTPPHVLAPSQSFSAAPDLFFDFLQTDFDALEESCTHIESLSLDVEEVRLALARELNSSSGSSLRSILAFIENGGPSPLWSNAPDDFDAPRKIKALAMCRAAMIKTVVEVTGENGTEKSLWDESSGGSGGEFVLMMVRWLTSYVSDMDAGNGALFDRPELATCASLSLGNLTRRGCAEEHATVLLSPPHSLASVLSSGHLLSPTTDIQVKHGVLGLLKHMAQALPPGSELHDAMGRAGLVRCICDSGVWDELTDGMAEVLQVSAIGVVKHMCNANVENAYRLVLPPEDEVPVPPSGLSQILALVKRANAVTVKSEGTRVLVNVVKSLWSSDIIGSPINTATSSIANGTVEDSAEKERKKQLCIKAVLTPQCATTLANLVGRSAQFPLLVNEGVVALTLLSTHTTGAPLVLKATLAALPFDTPPPPAAEPPSASTSVTTDLSSPTVATPSTRGRIPLLKTPLDMLIATLKNVDNPVNFQTEVRINVCSLFIQLGRNTSGEESFKVQETVKPVMEKVLDNLKDVKGKEEMLAKAIQKVLDTWV
ncbi:hypothetical protein D9757_001930 [Collybiopsis confluens]|uniref:ARM repeat superfamily protein n=1 Tax=Collybiopsis confluens TaxID=2823264 RepID=A0A8H5HXV5_9AGAR|nr:hypothetical protein D9757_001930 [Collybiopsis confluens]